MDSNSKSQAEVVEDQKTVSYEWYMEVGYVIGNNDHGYGQVCCNRCIKDVVLYLGYHHMHLENWFEKPS